MVCEECQLAQLGEQYSLDVLYGDNYGYRSSLNGSMARHLGRLAGQLTPLLQAGDIALDIGSNDGTLLAAYPDCVTRVGVDPTAAKFARFYPKDVIMRDEFFTADSFLELTHGEKAKVVTSIAMLYDLEDPVRFAKDVAKVLRDDGMWMAEQLYVGSMLNNLAYDAICQEHVEYYGMKQLRYIMAQAGFVITGLEFTETNGGSVCVVMEKEGEEHPDVAATIVKEEALDFADFAARVAAHPAKLHEVMAGCEKVAGFGASTKGNILLQHCNIGPRDVFAIADINKEKWGKVTATGIAILDPITVTAMEPSHYLVLPWHFRKDILERFKGSGIKFIFPLPAPEIVEA